MNIDEMRVVIASCKFPNYEFEVGEGTSGMIYLQAAYQEPDVDTGRPEWQYTRKWILSPHMVKSEIVQTVFKCVITSAEHRVREWFRYKDKAIFGPHYDVDVLHSVCDKTDKRKDPS